MNNKEASDIYFCELFTHLDPTIKEFLQMDDNHLLP